MRPANVILVTVLAVAGCGGKPVEGPVSVIAGTTPATGPPATSPASPTPALAPSPTTVTVTAGLRETAVTIRRGQTLLIRPAPGRPGRANAVLTEPDAGVLRGAGGNPAAGWRFLAVGRGTVHVGIVYGPQCVPGELCPMFRGLLGRVTVTVV